MSKSLRGISEDVFKCFIKVHSYLKRRVDNAYYSREYYQNNHPFWFQPPQHEMVERVLNSSKPVFLYQPWIQLHGNALITRLLANQDFSLVPLEFVIDLERNRKSLMRYANRHPDLYTSMVIGVLAPLAGKIKGFIFTVDWNPAMRLLSRACRLLRIPRILIPHEGVFADPDLYYSDFEATLASTPNADVVLAWNGIQKDIFVSRGVPENRILVTGAPKFDAYANGQAGLNREQFHRALGLDSSRKTVIFASQMLDKQFGDLKAASSVQMNAIRDAFLFAKENHLNFVLRVPPTKVMVISDALRREIEETDNCVIDGVPFYRALPEDSIRNADIVLSINSTMLLEAMLAGTAVLSLKYLKFKNSWENMGIPSVKNRKELHARLKGWLLSPHLVHALHAEEVAEYFSPLPYDGHAAERIGAYLSDFSRGDVTLELRNGPFERLTTGEDGRIDVLAIACNSRSIVEECPGLRKMLDANSLLVPDSRADKLCLIAGSDALVFWRESPPDKAAEIKAKKDDDSDEQRIQDTFAKGMALEKLYIDAGLLKSNRQLGHSIIFDDKDFYYSMSAPTRLGELLDSSQNVPDAQILRCRGVIDRIRLKWGAGTGRDGETPSGQNTAAKKILLLDQSRESRFLERNSSAGAVFAQMLAAADADGAVDKILLYRDPDGTSPTYSGFFPDSMFSDSAFAGKVKCIDGENDPHGFFNSVDAVWTLSSPYGFDALLAGIPVRCFGPTFYSGRGMTEDVYDSGAERRKRTFEELFYFCCVYLSRYYDAARDERISIEEYIDLM